MQEATYEDAYKEFDAQMELCYRILGKYPDVASVKNSELPLEKAFKAVVEKYGIAYNIFSSAPDHRHPTECDPKYKALRYYSSGLATNSSYKLEDFKDYQPLEKMMALRWTDAEEVFMYGWHPGYCDDHIMEESTCNLHRCKELQLSLIHILVLLHIPDDRTLVRQHPAFKMQIVTAVIHVGRTAQTDLIVADKGFGMDEARRVLIDLHACF